MPRYRNPFGPGASAAARRKRDREAAIERKILAESQPDPKHCRITQQSDEMVCVTCFMRWDVNDRDPPLCPRTKRQVPENGNHEIYDESE